VPLRQLRAGSVGSTQCTTYPNADATRAGIATARRGSVLQHARFGPRSRAPTRDLVRHCHSQGWLRKLLA